jgi:hypothetical protein
MKIRDALEGIHRLYPDTATLVHDVEEDLLQLGEGWRSTNSYMSDAGWLQCVAADDASRYQRIAF